MNRTRPAAVADRVARRRVLGIGAAALAACAMRTPRAAPPPGWLPAPALPDVPLLDQDGRAVRLERDLLAGRTVIVNFMFAGCRTVCPPQTALLREAGRRLKERPATREVLMLSITVDPLADGPAQLRAYAQRFDIALGADRGWVMLTGQPADVARLLTAFDVPAGAPGDHPSLLWLGSSPRGRWTRASSLNPPETVVALVEALQR